MGKEFQVICKKCGTKYTVRDGGGFFFHLLHCNKCGKDKSISFDELGDIHKAYLKGLGVPFCVASREYDKHIKVNQ